MITGKQCRAARALLDLSQQDLADLTNPSRMAIARFENDEKCSKQTIENLQLFFENHGIEFIGEKGVNLRDEYMYSLRGVDGMRLLYDDIYETAKLAYGDEFCIFNGVPDLILKWVGKEWYQDHTKRMVDVKDNIIFKVIIEEGTDNLIGDAFVEYRYWPSGSFLPEMIYIYGNKVAFFSFSEDNVDIKVNVSSKQAESMRVLFSSAWDERAIRIND
ncbi:MAG: hypothetical protein GC137_00255 [Alphaproteobacteria bacterium]|nr:hypothetical protein [Alphaproteobacteria bacterium]